MQLGKNSFIFMIQIKFLYSFRKFDFNKNRCLSEIQPSSFEKEPLSTWSQLFSIIWNAWICPFFLKARLLIKISILMSWIIGFQLNSWISNHLLRVTKIENKPNFYSGKNWKSTRFAKVPTDLIWSGESRKQANQHLAGDYYFICKPKSGIF